MSRVVFEPSVPVAAPDPARTDVACFVGLVRIASSLASESAIRVDGDAVLRVVPTTELRANDSMVVGPGFVVPVDGQVVSGSSMVNESAVGGTSGLVKRGVGSVVLGGSRNVTETLTVRATIAGSPIAPLAQSQREWLIRGGWAAGPNARDSRALLDVPIPVENFATFQSSFDDGTSDRAVGTDYLAVAVRSFFAQGGKKAYVIRMGDPLTPSTTAAERQSTGTRLLGPNSSAGDPRSWSGMAHLWGLPDVSFLILPDLPVLHATDPKPAQGARVDASAGPEVFVQCIPGERQPTEQRVFPTSAPRLSRDDYRAWGKTVRSVVTFLSAGSLREVQFVAAMPLPYEPSSALSGELSVVEANDLHTAIDAVFPESADSGSASSAFVQVAYPWLRSTRSNGLLDGIEPPDGTLAGVLARNALVRGTFLSATKITPADIIDLVPRLPQRDTVVPDNHPMWGSDAAQKPLITRLTLFGFTPAGIRLLSDVTTFPGESYRPGSVSRLISVVDRTARLFAQDHVFDHNGPRLWAQLEHTLRQLMTRLWGLSALDGARASDAFDVRCNRSTMTQNDIDNGRLIATITFRAASVVELIQISLTADGRAATVADLGAQMLGAN